MPLAVYLLALGCAHPPAAKPASSEQPVHVPGDLAGTWSSSDDLDFNYQLVISGDGTYDLWVDRNKMGRCEQKGALATAPQPRTFALTYRINDCHREAVGTTDTLTIESFTGTQLIVAIGADRHVYQRVSDAAASTR
jgi:hypothetical protein